VRSSIALVRSAPRIVPASDEVEHREASVRLSTGLWKARAECIAPLVELAYMVKHAREF